MDSLEKELMLRDAANYGYQLFQPESQNPTKFLQRMLQDDDARILEGFPVVLTNVLLNNPNLDLKAVETGLPSPLQRRFRMLAALTYLFLFWVSESDKAKLALSKYLKNREPALIENVQDKLRNQGKVSVGNNVVLDAERLEKTYRNYVVRELMESKASLSKQLEDKRQGVFQEALGELFTDKQRELLLKMLNKESLTKTEREYYSRVVKPRLKALRNPDLQSLASSLLGY